MSISDRRVVVVALATCLVAVAVPSGASAYRRYRTARERAKLAHFLQDPQAPDDGWHEDPEEAAERLGAEKVDGLRESDDPLRRAIASRVAWGNPTADVAERYAQLAHRESVRWAPLMPGAGGGIAPRSLVTAPSWVNVGPTSAAFEWNAVTYPGVDSGRMSGLLVNPSDAAQVIVALSGGGMWKTFNFGAPSPSWAPIGDALPNLSIGAIDANPANFNELYVGTGDFIDGIGGQMVKTVTGGVVWSAPLQLTGSDPNRVQVKAQRVLMVKVDPANPNVVLVGTDVGLFRSVDAGASYALVDLPNASGPARLEKVWTLAYTGQVGGVSRWAASGMAACDPTSRPPEVFFAVQPGTGCTNGNQGDIWISTDAGATWASQGAVPGKLPALTAGRITMAAGTPSTANPPVTVLYAQVSSEDETGGGDPMGFWRSVDSGVTWTAVAGTMGNPTRDPPGPDTEDCLDVNNLGVGQGAYNHALAVDPGDSTRAFAGGMLCAMRITNGTGATPLFENVTHWLPFVSPYGDTGSGTLSYAHADHHRALIVRSGATVRALLATDGGLYYSDTLFAAGSPTNANVIFRGANTGLVTHLVFGMGSGDPATGAPNRVVIGLQDNGTRLRDFAAAPTTFNQVIGGDGYGAAYGRDPTSGAEVYWAASNFSHDYCIPSGANSQCNAGGSFTTKDPSITCLGAPQADTMPFKNVYAPVLPATAPNTFLSSSDHGVFRIAGPPSTNNWQSIVTAVQDVSGSTVGNNCMPSFVRFVAASQTTDGIYGVALSGGRYAVTSGCTGTSCTWTRSAVVGLDINNSGAIDPNERTSFTSSLAFPPGPTPGHNPGDVYVVTTTASITQDNKTPVPDALGHVFITNNRGASFQALHGNGTGQDLPNVPVNVVRYDTADTANNTIFVGTLIGVYRTADGGNTWQRYGSGLPLASVTDMFIGKNGGIVRVGTYGRGVWELYPNAGAERGVSGNGDFDANTQIDFIDLAALAIRLGTNPAGSSAPFYDWTVDLTGTTNAVDDADLTALLAKFGDHP